MVERKRSGRPPQLQHRKKSTPPQHYGRNRLSSANPTRRKTDPAIFHLYVSQELVGVLTSMAPLESTFQNDPRTIQAGCLSAMSVEASPFFGTRKFFGNNKQR
jgi:hypothetical protein